MDKRRKLAEDLGWTEIHYVFTALVGVPPDDAQSDFFKVVPSFSDLQKEGKERV